MKQRFPKLFPKSSPANFSARKREAALGPSRAIPPLNRRVEREAPTHHCQRGRPVLFARAADWRQLASLLFRRPRGEGGHSTPIKRPPLAVWLAPVISWAGCSRTISTDCCLATISIQSRRPDNTPADCSAQLQRRMLQPAQRARPAGQFYV